MRAGTASFPGRRTAEGRAMGREARRVVVQFAVAVAVLVVLVLASPWIVIGLARVYGALHR
ncbi:hypothetical protein GCM10009759_56770 [Kitasatospora saccharophila]|uniref:Uncharacterized protein n=1 Tax=Kitasatospora saccharophila TaxID=407973 RepID=A0ABN2XKG2_9ACTN